MKVTRSMLDPEIRRYWFLGRLIATMFHFRVIARWIGRIERPLFSGKNIKGLRCQQRFIPSRNGQSDIRVRIYQPAQSYSQKLPAMLYLHGGGYMCGVPEHYHEIIASFIATAPCLIVAPDYTKSLTAPYPAGFNDCYDTLLWLKENAASLGVHDDQFIVAGHSAGGGLTAAVTLKATDTGDVKIAFQMPIYPMIDDRQTSASAVGNTAPVWDSRNNKLGWELYLKDLIEIPPYAAPARATDFSRLPPAITFVGSLEPFCDETVLYVERLRAVGVPVEFELFAGGFHGFDILCPSTKIGARALHFTYEKYREFVQRYFS